MKWDDIIEMPYAELAEYVDRLGHWTDVISAGATSKKGK